MWTSPRAMADAMERNGGLPTGPHERFAGYGVIGLPFTSGHFLAFRRVPASSLGEGYTTIWHRAPTGRWTFFTDVEPRKSCPRFFGEALDAVVVGDIAVRWEAPLEVSVKVPDRRFQWGVRLSSDLSTWVLNGLGRLVPGLVWKRQRFLSVLETVGGRLLGAGRVGLMGTVPNGQTFRAGPWHLWRVEASTAILEGADLGEVGPLGEQVRLGGFWLPRTGIFVFGDASFDSFDPHRHSAAVTRPMGKVAVLGVPKAPGEDAVHPEQDNRVTNQKRRYTS